MPIQFSVNGKFYDVDVEPRHSLADVLRENLGLTGTHLGCEHGVCGACTVLLDGRPVRSCLLFAVQAQDSSIFTVEGLANEDGTLHLLQQVFSEHHGLQCGFCTPGMLISALDLFQRCPNADRDKIRAELSGNICRCTGYNSIVDAVQAAFKALGEVGGE